VRELRIAHQGRVAILTLNRPDCGNRLTAALARELASALRTLRGDDDVGACVLTGHGDVFCLGGDYAGAGTTTAERTEYANALIAMVDAMANLGKPLIAAQRSTKRESRCWPLWPSRIETPDRKTIDSFAVLQSALA
jgi:enoyl-CoA hydratase/carnithine racemase